MKVRADLVLRALQKKHTEKQAPDAFFTQVKNGRTMMARNGELLILDAVAIKKSWENPLITGYEVKVSRNDFVRDDKWPGYLKYCHQFYFVAPSSVIEPEDLAEGVGLIHYNPETEMLRTKRKAGYRQIDLPLQMLYYLVIARLDDSKHPFFKGKREYLEAYLQDKKDRKEMGWRVGTKMAEDISRLAKENETLQKELKNLSACKDDLDKIRAVCRKKGIDTYWRLSEELEEVLSQKAGSRVLNQVDILISQANKIKNMLQPTEEAEAAGKGAIA